MAPSFPEQAARHVREQGIGLKVNTVLHRRNVSSLRQLAQRVADLRPDTWSIFEWNPSRSRPELVRRMALEHGQFADAVQEIRGFETGLAIREGSLASRSLGNAIIQCDGRVLTAGSFSRCQVLLGDVGSEPLDVILQSIGYRRQGRKSRPADRFPGAIAATGI